MLLTTVRPNRKAKLLPPLSKELIETVRLSTGTKEVQIGGVLPNALEAKDITIKTIINGPR